MPQTHFEVVYETGNMSVVDAADRDDAIAGIRAHHERAQKGIPGYGGPRAAGEPPRPAERIVKVFEYDSHPHDLAAPLSMSTSVAKPFVNDCLKAATDENGVVDLVALASAVLPKPLNPDAGVHDSKYNAEGKDVTKEVLA